MSMLAALTLSSCGVYTKYKPATSVPDALYGEDVQAADSANNIGMKSWRDMFADEQLQTLIEKGLAQNTDFLSAQLRIEESQATLKAANLAFLPSFSLAPQGTVSSFDKGKATQTYSLPVTASWQLDIFGNLRNARKQSKALYAQSKDYAQAVQCQLVCGIANSYYTLLMLDKQLELSEKTAKNWSESLEATKAMKEAGMTTQAAVSQSEATVLSVQASIADLKDQIHQVENSLCLLLAETPHNITRGKLDDQTISAELNAGVPLQLLSNRPDVRSSERSLESAFYGVNQARSAFYPSITLSGSAGWTNSAGSMIINPGKFLASAVGSLTQPLFANGKLTAQLKIAKARQQEAALSFQQTLLNAGSEVNNALTAYQTAEEKSEILMKQISSLKQAVESTELLMQHGTTTYLEVLTARQSLLSAELDEVTNQFNALQSTINFYQALGGGSR